MMLEMKQKKVLFTVVSVAVIAVMTGCASLDRQNPPPKKNPPPQAAAVKKPPKKELTAAQIAAMTPEQLVKYHAEKRKAQEQEEKEMRRRQMEQQVRQRENDKARGNALVDSFMEDRPSKEKRRRLGDVNRQLNYGETSIFPWRDGRRSEGLLNR